MRLFPGNRVLARLGDAVLMIWSVFTIVFIVSRMLGDPAVLLLPMGASLADINELRAQLGLNDSLLVQYLSFFRHALVGDFGMSFENHRPAFNVILDQLPATVELAVAALAIGIVVGGVSGLLAARFRGGIVEFLAMGFALAGQSVPAFWLGIMLIMVFAVQLGWLPPGGIGGVGHLILPAFTLSTFASASIARLLRANLGEVLAEDYIRTAWSKGMRPSVVYFRHALPNALIAVITMVGILAGELLGGAVITETVFSWPGVGRVIVQAILSKDFSVVQAGVALLALIFVVVNLSVDLLYGLLDPRVRTDR